MSQADTQRIAARLQKAWAQLSPAQRAQVKPQLDAADDHLQDFKATGDTARPPQVVHQLLRVKSLIEGDLSEPVSPAAAVRAAAAPADAAPGAIEISVSPGGEIYGTGKYQQLDPGWAESAAIWLEHMITGKHNFPTADPRVIPIADNVSIAIGGDFGTGDWPELSPSPALKVNAAIVGQHPDYTIHLGDVYYAGTSAEEQANLLPMWPPGNSGMAFTLNSNHEMYSGANGYFNVALANAMFQAQGGLSFFALENSNWVIVALDSAYYSDEVTAYMNGALSANADGSGPQLDFLKAQVAKGKKVIVLTHHNGLNEDGTLAAANTPEGTLWTQVMNGFPAGTGPAYWYWGHVHAGTVYVPQKAPGSNAATVQCRCTGHAALPWGFASQLANNANVAWFERTSAGDPNLGIRVRNGFTLLTFAGANVTETFFDETGNQAWPVQTAAAGGE